MPPLNHPTPDNDSARPALDLDAIRERLARRGAKSAWTSLEELAESEEFLEFLHQEFPRETSWVQHLSRRDFLKLLAAPLALAGLAACVPQPAELIMPYVEPPAGLTPGVAQYFATAMELDGYARGLLVESHQGRPVKVEGNPQHPASLGATDAFAQASILDLYDPARAQVITNRGRIRPWESFLAELTDALRAQSARQGQGLCLLTGTITSPTLAAQIRALLEQCPQARWYQYDPARGDNVQRGAEMAFGEPVQPQYRFDRADVILSLDSDFLFREPGSLRYTREFAARRNPAEGDVADMNRLYVVESSPTITGASADHRLALQAGQVPGFARLLARQLGLDVAPPQGEISVPAGWIEALAADLQSRAGASLVLAGPQQPPQVHALAHAMNDALGNTGQTVVYTDPVEAQPADQTGGLAELAQALRDGMVELLVVIGGDPVYTAPADLDFPAAFENAGLRVYLGAYSNATAALSDWHIPQSHYLEAWGDTRAYDGTVTIVQPLILPLYNSRSAYELLAAMLGQAGQEGYEIVRSFWQAEFERAGGAAATPAAGGEPGAGTAVATPGAEGAEGTPAAGEAGEPETTTGAEPADTLQAGRPLIQPGGEALAGGFDRFWRSALHDGLVPGTALPAREDLNLRAELLAELSQEPEAPAGPESLELVFAPDPSVWDGRFAYNAWLQELPRPLTKLTWDNAAFVSPATAARLGLQNEDEVELQYRERTVRAPAWILPGMAENSVTVHMGYGQTAGGEVAATGFNAYALRASDAPWGGYGLALRRTGGRYRLATTQDHSRMEGRDLVRMGTAEQYRQNPDFAHEGEHTVELPETIQGAEPPSLYPEYEYPANAWGMAINLSSCTGCNACVMACVAENNIPVVGKDQVQVGREMHWLRLDRYFHGDLDQPDISFQPVLCMHCEQAPCEPVCPVNATVHDSEGLNEMVYNRCIGTRYCSNNCPYKVRRFNFFQYADADTLPLKMGRNPDVTVRSRGVMEKCTYCIQRIQEARVRAQIEGRPIDDGEVVTACQQACPANAISFGDIANPESRVRQWKDSPLNYGLLEELGTQPRTTYLARLRNPNPDMPGGA